MRLTSSSSPRGFTLIELLVVVAVISVLAAIALPNLLEAQMRAKITRTHADMRTMATAIESYAVDQNRVPRMTWGGNPYNDKYSGFGAMNEPIWGTLGPWVTTPIAYVTKYDFLDQFVGRNEEVRMDARLYTYHDLQTTQFLLGNGFYNNPGPRLGEVFEREFGAWATMSVGPDLNWNGNNDFWMQYDATNGTVSEGNIWRSQKYNDQHFVNFSDAYSR